MLTRLFLIFAVVPVVEIYLLIRVGRVIGPLPTVALLLCISFAGAWLVRREGFNLLRRIQAELDAGRLPAAELVDGSMVLIGGILLLSPGFFTDAVGIFFIIPITRQILKRLAQRMLARQVDRGTIIIHR